MPLALGVDVGGTFTDFVLIDDAGQSRVLKLPTDAADTTKTIVAGMRSLLERSRRDPEEVQHFVHGTTTALNTLLQRKGARVGLLVTDGFADVLEIGRARLPVPNNIYVDKYQPLVRREMVRPVRERLLSDGSVRVALDEDDVGAATQELLAQGAEALAVCFLHAYRNPAHERRAQEIIRERFPGVYICTSTDLWPQQREYERATLAVINAHIGDRMRRYFETLGERVRVEGVRATVFSTKSNGGVMTAEAAAERPVETLISGPAAGVIGAGYLGQLAGFSRLIAMDVGGTSADISIVDREFGYTTETRVGDFPIIVPAVEVTSIGAGGGSIAWVDEHGVLKVGPESAGSDPGPACYGRGGRRPTVTDAYVANGWIDPDRFLGGTLPLDRALALHALEELGRTLSLEAAETADAILTVASANMYAQIMPLLARAGVDPREFALCTYGGAGPTHGFMLAKEVGLSTVVVPPAPGILCAFGCLVADLRADFVRTILHRADRLAVGMLEQWYRDLEQEGREWLARQRARVEETAVVRSAQMRYLGQSFEIDVPLSGISLTDSGMRALHARFHETYQRVYRVSDVNAPVEIVNIRLQIVGRTPKPPVPTSATAGPHQRLQPERRRAMRIGGEIIQADVYTRKDLPVGAQISGPCVVEQYDTTSVIPPGFQVTVDRWGNLVARQS